jgi:hypothetical protein
MTAGTRYVILAEFTPYDPVAAAAVTVRACSVDDASVTSLNGVAWWPAISQAPRRTLDLFDGEFGGKISAGIGDIEIALAAFPDAARYAWGERPVKLWRGVLGAAWAGYTLIFEGLTRPPRAGNGRMRIGLRVDDRWLDKPLLATYAGTGSAEGPADLKGQPKPLAIGAPQFVEGVIINRTLNIVQLHGYGAINGVPAALSRLSRYSAAAGNDASYAALAGATIAAGAWRTCLAEGLVRFGAPPGGVASFLMQGDSGSALGWVRTPGQVIRRIALIAGASAGQIDATSLAALDTACPYNISLFLRDQATARDVIQSIAASCNAAAGVSWLGKLFVARTAIGSPALTLSADGATLPPVANVEMLESSAPFWRTALEGARTWRVHSAGEFETLTDAAYSDGTSLDSLRPATPGATRNVVTYSASPPGSPVDGDLWVDTSGAFAVFNLRSGGVWVTGANALSAYNTLSGKPVALSDINTTESSKLAGIEAGADVTATAVPSLSVPPLVTVNYDFTGTAVSGALPATLRAIRKRGDTDVSASTTWSLTGSGFTASISSDGEITITDTTASGTMTVVSERDGVTLSQDVAINRVIGAAPSAGGSGGTSASDSSIDSIASNSYGAAIAGMLTVKTGSAGQIDLTAPLTITRGATAPAGTFGVRLKWQWRIVGGSYADAASEVSETTALVVTDEGGGFYTVEDGSVTCNATVTGLAATTDYEVQLLGRTSSGSTSRGMIGTATAVGT